MLVTKNQASDLDSQMQPDEFDATKSDSEHVIDDVCVDDEGEVPEGDSGVLVVQPADPSLLTMTRDGSSLVIGYNNVQILDDLCIAGYREQVFRMLAENESCRKLIFDVTNIKFLPSGMLGLLASVIKSGRKVEVLNPSADVRDVLHVTRLDELLTIRNGDS